MPNATKIGHGMSKINVENHFLLHKVWLLNRRYLTELKLSQQFLVKNCDNEFHETLTDGFDAGTR
jgi:hypothetical protein